MGREMARSQVTPWVSGVTLGFSDGVGIQRELISRRVIGSDLYFHRVPLATVTSIGLGEAGTTKTEERHQVGS